MDKKIHDKTAYIDNYNLELQALVIATIDKYKATTVAGGAQPLAGPGGMTAELVRRRRGKRATPGAEEAADAGDGGAQPPAGEGLIHR